MPITEQILGTRRRIHIAKKALKDADLSGAIDQYVFNVVAGSGMMNPHKPNVLPNANSAQGQGPMTSKIFRGRDDIQGTIMTNFNAEYMGMVAAGSLPAGAVAAAASGYAHTSRYTQTVGFDELQARTMEEHHDGSDVTSYMDYMLGQTICTGWRINVTRGSDFSTLSHDWVARDNVAGHDLSAKDVVANWPSDPSFTAPKVGLWIEKNASDYNTAWDTTVSIPATQATPYHDLTSPISLGEFYETLEMRWASNIDVDMLYKGGTSTGAGIQRKTDGAVIVTEPHAECVFTADLDDTVILQELVNYFKDIDNDDPSSYSIYMCAVSDELAAAGCYYGTVIVLPAVYPVDVTLPTDNAPTTISATLRAMQDLDGNAIIHIVTFDAEAVDYYATS